MASQESMDHFFGAFFASFALVPPACLDIRSKKVSGSFHKGFAYFNIVFYHSSTESNTFISSYFSYAFTFSLHIGFVKIDFNF